MRKNFYRSTAVFLFLLFWARLLQTAVIKSITFDEILHILQGVLYWQKWSLFSVVQNPPLINAIIGFPINFIFQPNLPTIITSDVLQDWLIRSNAFLWQVNENGLQMVWVGRLAIIYLSLLLAALAYRWGRELFGRISALLVLTLFTFAPNILANSFLATTDMGIAFFLFLAAYSVWRYWQTPLNEAVLKWRYLVAGLAIGLAFAAKFSAIILVPALLLIVAYRLVTDADARPFWRRFLLEVGGWLLMGTFVFLMVYRFSFPALTVDFTFQQEHQFTGHSAFLMGQTKIGGWFYYFPVIFTLKTPLTLLALLGGTLFLFISRRQWEWSRVWLWLLVAGIAGAGVVSNVNIGYRYLLPMLPFLYLLIGQLAQPAYVPTKRWRWVIITAVFLFALESLWIHPHYLAYFNQLAGGSANGWQIAVDSNLDWGQDVGLLAQAQKENGWPTLRANWLGTVPPSVYGLEVDFLPGWPWRKVDTLMDDFYPHYPASGMYALSATQLQGVYMNDSDYFHWFRQQTPMERIGYSFFVYEVPSIGNPTGLALSGVGVSSIDVDDYAAMESNDVHLRWFDSRTAILRPNHDNEAEWVLVGDGHQPPPPLAALYPAKAAIPRGTGDDGWRYSMYYWQDGLITAVSPPALYTDFGWTNEPVLGAAKWDRRLPLTSSPLFSDTLQLEGVWQWTTDVKAGAPLEIVSFWRVENVPAGDLKLFIHLVDAQGNLIAQHDGLDARMTGVRAGDEIAQLHTIWLPPDLPSGEYALQIGVYERATNGRLSIIVDGEPVNRVLLYSFVIDGMTE